MKKIILILLLFAISLPVTSADDRYARPAFIISETKKKYDISIKRKQNKLVLYQQVLLWDGVPYKFAGNSKNGIDCSGLVARLLNKSYKKNISGPSTVLYKKAKKIPKKSLKEGDLVFFKINSRRITHVGVYLKDDKFVHASTKRGVMVSSLNESYYDKYYYSAGRILDSM